MMSKNSRATVALLSFAACSLIALMSFGIYHIRKESKQTQGLLAAAAEVEKKEIVAKAIRTVQNTASRELEAFEKIALTDSTLVLAIENIENTARALKLDAEINSVDKVGESSETEPQKIRVAVDSIGSWSNSFLFLKAVENLPYRVIFESVSLEKRGTEWESKIIISLYIFN